MTLTVHLSYFHICWSFSKPDRGRKSSPNFTLFYPCKNHGRGGQNICLRFQVKPKAVSYTFGARLLCTLADPVHSVARVLWGNVVAHNSWSWGSDLSQIWAEIDQSLSLTTCVQILDAFRDSSTSEAKFRRHFAMSDPM